MGNLHPTFQKIVEAHGAPVDPVPWADLRLRSAYLLLQEVRGEWHPEDGVGEALKRALDEIESADCEIGELSRPHNWVLPANADEKDCPDCCGEGCVTDDDPAEPDICLECNGTGKVKEGR